MKIFKNSNTILSTAIIFAGLMVSFVVIDNSVSAQANPAFPIAELGNCTNQAECASFCDNENNITSCVNYAEQKGMIGAQEATEARKFAKIGSGPGGCKSKSECATYCDSIDNMDSCLQFAATNGLVNETELAEAKKVAEALKSGAKMPGGCKNKADCESYCNASDKMEECLNFAEKANLIPENELADARKVAKALKSGQKQPGGCANKKSCDSYCSDSAHMEECVNFALAADLIPPEEVEAVKKILPLMKAGKMPGGCFKKEECDTYCADSSHTDECANFAIEAGFMKPEEVEMYKKTGGKGPGNCKGKEECETYCDDPDNQETCTNFAMEKGLIPEAELQEMKAGAQKFNEGLQMATPEVLDCIKSKVGESAFSKMQAGGMPTRDAGEAMGSCFGSLMKPPSGGEGGGYGAPEGYDTSKGLPSAEDIQKMVPEGVEVTPEMMKNGPPSQEQIQNMIQNKVQEEMQKRGAPSGGMGVPSIGTQSASPSTPNGGSYGPSQEEIQNMIPKNIPTGPSGSYGPPQ